ncbi:YgcG family protein [Mesoflavibacter zeaxanthinifaciens]|uniref:TPM domain-containing protein n=1 Tax=Mesoflavibacter zeaxanthinifaciens TaxID=393060 RepID=UPI0026F18E17|nr:TPM domain-containing protein [Mesoflavibacter zeaxanthinifaciens]
MKYFTFILAFVFCISCKTKPQQTLKHNQTVVQDYANIFSTVEEDSLTNFILNYEKLTTNEICVMTIDSLPANTKALRHATNIAQNLGIGKADKNNGLLLLIAKSDRQVAFATGYGTELVLTDSVCYHLIESTLIPNFKNKLYYNGVRQVLDSVKTKWY